jgi:hypothetical protein
VSDKVNTHEKFGVRRKIVNGVAQRGGKPIVRIFGQFMCGEKDDEAIERFRADKQKENTAIVSKTPSTPFMRTLTAKRRCTCCRDIALVTSTAPRRSWLYALQLLGISSRR